MDKLKTIDENYQDMFQIGVTPEMLGVKMEKLEINQLGKVNVDKAIESVYGKQVWNAAIEAAASVADRNYGYPSNEIRKLKK